MKYFVISAQLERLKMMGEKLKNLDANSEVFLSERLDRFFDDYDVENGPVKIIIDFCYDDDFDRDNLKEFGRALEEAKFKHCKGLTDIYVFDNALGFSKHYFKYKNAEVRIHQISLLKQDFNNLFKFIYKDSYSPKRILFFDQDPYFFANQAKEFLESEIFESNMLNFNDKDAADFSFYLTSSKDDFIVISKSAQCPDFYLRGAQMLGAQCKVLVQGQKTYDLLAKLDLSNVVSNFSEFNMDFVKDDYIHNKFMFINLVEKYYQFLCGCYEEYIHEDILQMIEEFDFSSLELAVEELKYVFKNKKNNKGITYCDFSNVPELVKKIDNDEITNEEVFVELEKTYKYVTGIPAVGLRRFMKFGRLTKKYEHISFDDGFEDFTSFVSEGPFLLLRDDYLVSYAMLLAAVSIF